SPTHTVIMYETGVIEAYGNNNRGQCDVNNWRNIIQIVAQEGLTLGLCEDGSVLYAGYSYYVEDMTVISQWYDIVSISAGGGHVVAVDCNGRVYAAGSNTYAQSTVQGMTQVGRIAAGGEHTVGIRFDGTITGVGRNNDSRLVLPSVDELPRVALIDVKFSAETFGVRVGQTKRTNLEFSPYNASDRKAENISYSSSLTHIAFVDNEGYVTGVSAGTVEITATVRKSDGGQETTTVTVYVYESVASVERVSSPTKITYGYNERLDLLGGKIKINLTDGKSFVTPVTPDMVVGYQTATAQLGDAINITVSECGVSLDYCNIKVINVVKDVSISNMANLKTVYDYGDDIDLAGGWIRITRAYGEEETVTMDNLLMNSALEVIADTEILATTTVTLKYTDSIAMDAGVSNVFYLSFPITVFDKVIGLTAQMDKTSFKYGEDIFGNGKLIVNMQSGINIFEDIAEKAEIEEGVDSVIIITNYDKYMLGVQTVKINYFNPDFDIPLSFFPTLDIAVEDTISDVEITSMLLDDAAVYDRTKAPDSSITVRVSFAGGAVIDVGIDGEQQMFANIMLVFGEVSAGDQEGFAKVSMEIKVLEKLNNSTQYNRKYYDNDLKVLGLGSISSLTFIGASEFPYGEKTDLMLEIKTDNDVPYLIKIDDARLGIDNKLLETQTVNFSLLGRTATKSIIFRDFETGIYTQYLNVNAVYGQPLQLTVYKTMASGIDLEITDGWESNFDSLKEGLQQVTIRYKENHAYTINVTVLNTIASINVVSSPKTTYQIHEDIDLSEFSIRLNFQKGDSETMLYAPDKFSVTGYDKNIIGIQIVTITFDLTGDYWEYAFEVRNRIKRIEVDREESKIIYTVGEELDITLICVFENGDRIQITDEFVDNFDKNLIGVEQVVNLIYWGTYSTAIIVEIIDAPREITIKAPTKKYYEYGEPLSLEGGVLTITTQTGKRKTESLHAYRNYLSSFNPTPQTKGGQMLTLAIPQYNISASFIVYVKDKATSIMLEPKESVTGIRVDRTNTRVILENSATLATFNSMVSSYGSIYYKSGDAYLDLGANQNAYISSGVKVEIKNSEGTLIESFSVFVKGDANGNGIFNSEDLTLLGQGLLLGSENAVYYADYDSDREYTLTDFVNWVKKAEDEQRGTDE
ncbi:MAG: Ig-like domain-containing protein, partial [Clostridia bacterium]|nr:Ig-like domain-containing protein [Clostridia bacterium]